MGSAEASLLKIHSLQVKDCLIGTQLKTQGRPEVAYSPAREDLEAHAAAGLPAPAPGPGGRGGGSRPSDGGGLLGGGGGLGLLGRGGGARHPRLLRGGGGLQGGCGSRAGGGGLCGDGGRGGRGERDGDAELLGGRGGLGGGGEGGGGEVRAAETEGRLTRTERERGEGQQEMTAKSVHQHLHPRRRLVRVHLRRVSRGDCRRAEWRCRLREISNVRGKEGERGGGILRLWMIEVGRDSCVQFF